MSERDSFKAPQSPIKSTWNEIKLLMRGPLTDKRIEQYRKAGWYSAELKEARRERNAKRMVKREMRVLSPEWPGSEARSEKWRATAQRFRDLANKSQREDNRLENV